MKELITIGEALIDFIPDSKGKALKDVISFKRVAGGAPANVAGAVSKLGGKATVLTKLGKDAFGDYIIDTLVNSGINTEYIKQTEDYDTSLAFVSLKEDGNRDFKFYRKTAADLNFNIDDIPSNITKNASIIHFCSVDLVESPMKKAHLKLIEMAKKDGLLVSFDPNLRFPLWSDLELLKKTVNEFMLYADILKISDEELEFITGYKHIEDALESLFNTGIKLIIYTKGQEGASIYTKDYHINTSGINVDVVDTTGAGDSFIGAFIYCLLNDGINDLNDLESNKLQEYLDFSNRYAACTCTKEGALASMADMDEFKLFMRNI